MGGEGERLGMVAGAAGGDPGGRVAERDELVHRPADLERTGALQVLGLEGDVPPRISESGTTARPACA